MASCSRSRICPVIACCFVSFPIIALLSAAASVSSAASSSASATAPRADGRGGRGGGGNGTRRVAFGDEEELRRFRSITARLARLRDASVKTIQSPDGDVIDCVPTHLQPAFEHPKLRGHKPEVGKNTNFVDQQLSCACAAQRLKCAVQSEPTERPRDGAGGHAHHGGGEEQDDGDGDGEGGFLPQAWHRSGEWCPEGSIPVRRTTEDDVLRASSVARFGMKTSTAGGHEHAVGYVSGGQVYGAKASLNVWAAQVASPAEFSLSQVWLIAGAFGRDLNTVEAGWQVSPELYGDGSPRLFVYWTGDAYRETGCYNLHCSGFVQTSPRVALGAAISPVSALAGRQFDVTLLVWKDPRPRGHWWLQLGGGGGAGAQIVGYWPAALFTRLGARATMAQFGGEVVNARPAGAPHTPTQMGSGRFPAEGYGRAAYFRNVQVVDWDNSLVPAAGIRTLADRPGCYDIAGGSGGAWGTYFYYGGPGRNARCP
ncbi:hypothetical protein U9M48_042322 [Paspalum notatum var. saurae]|uniref:Neprosin PEP catalytic domain-containing protein n=1 Tax=Paspalum notatum var. saurae TaxID=547442 RepID=A0AAQ3UR70_PASNO